MSKVSFYIKSLTDFHYFIPLSRFFEKKGIVFFAENNVLEDENLSNFSSHLEINSILSASEIHKSSIKYLFSKDCDFVCPQDFSNRNFYHIIIQNYHDFSLFFQKKENRHFYNQSDAFWASNFGFGGIMAKLGYNKKIISGLLPSYWDYVAKDETKKIKKTAICFLPRENEIILDWVKDLLITPEEKTFFSGDPEPLIAHAKEFGNFLENFGYSVTYKQRKRHGNKNPPANYIEAEEFYPNKSIELAFSADLGYGYMTSAMLHFEQFGKKYINFNNKNYPEILKKMFSLSVGNSIVDFDLSQKKGDVIKLLDRKHKNKIDLEQKLKNIQERMMKIVR